MPTIKTGNAEWDQNLTTLGNALFPDPSKAASAYYYGTKSRESLLQSAKTQNQLAAENTRLGMSFGRQPNPTYRPGPFDTSIMNDPYAVPAAPGPTAPPAPPGAPVPPVQALPTLANTVANTPPAALAQAVVAGIENNASSGPGPEATGSNGTVPQNGPGTFRPGSVTSAGGGGVVMAPPASGTGSPAPASFNMGQNVALGIAAGLTPEAAMATPLATLGEMVKGGHMALPLAEELASFYGRPQMRVQTLADQGALARTQLTEAGATTRTGMTEAGAMARQQLTTGEQRRADEMHPTMTVDEAGKPIWTGRREALGKGAYDPTAASAGATERQRQAGLTGIYMHPTMPGRTVEVLKSEAMAQGLQPAPATLEAAQAPMSTAIFGAPTPAAAAPLIEQRDRAAPPPRKPEIEKAKDEVAQQWMLNRQLAATIPPSPVTGFFGGVSSDQSTATPAGAGPALGPILTKLANDYHRSGPPGVKGEWTAASNAAIQQGVEEGWIRPDQPKTTPIILPTGENSVPTQHFQIDLYDPADKTKPINQAKPLPLGSRFTPTMKGATLGAAATTPAGAIGAAPAGTPDGPRTMGGKPVVVRGGYIFPG